jgi:hypothetical protein
VDAEREELARLLYRELGFVAPWGRHPDRVLKFRKLADAVWAAGWRKMPRRKVAGETKRAA